MHKITKQRARFVFLAIVLFSLFLISKIFKIQIVDGDKYIAKSASQHTKPNPTLFNRGTIFFTNRDGSKISGASVSQGFLLFAVPKLISDNKVTYDILSQYIDLDKKTFLEKTHIKDDPYEELVHRIDSDVAREISNLALPGIRVTPESWRTYPGGTLAAHVLGLVGHGSGSEISGKYGLERYYDKILNRSTQGDANQSLANILNDSQNQATSTISGDLITSIEPTVQGYLEKTLENIVKTWKPSETGGIIMDPNTGDIIAMASLPSFDPNDTSSVSEVAIFSNPNVEKVYEMGSIMKPITMAIGIDSGAITKDSTYMDTGTMTLNGKKISNYDGKARGLTDMQNVLSQSLNVGAANIALKVGKEKFPDYMINVGLGNKTGVDLPSEAASLIQNIMSKRDIEIATASYGQGISISPINMIRALAVIANGGRVIRPHIVKEIDYVDGTKALAKDESYVALRKESTAEVTKMLVQVVDTALKKGQLKNDRYSIAAKTGTAQIPDPATKSYFKDRYLHSFFGYFPAYNPKFIVFLYQVHPKGAEYASETLADPFSDLSKFLINFYNISPDR
jgi:cell division protein FtsI/penicillin-binding protein 2